MSKAEEITLLQNPAYHTMVKNGYISNAREDYIKVENEYILINVTPFFNKEYFN